jgi:hypothetical protein
MSSSRYAAAQETRNAAVCSRGQISRCGADRALGDHRSILVRELVSELAGDLRQDLRFNCHERIEGVGP